MVIVGVLILSGAVNTSIIGANGVLNRVAEDGVLLEWFRKPQKRFGTTYRIINLIAIAQMVTIIGSRGDVYLLGEAYAFGVVWSFFMKGLGVLVLRFQRHDQEYKTPLNFRIGKTEIPVGLGGYRTRPLFRCDRQLILEADRDHLRRFIYGCPVCRFPHLRARQPPRMQDDKTGLEKFNLDHQLADRGGTHPRPPRLRSGCRPRQ